MMHHKEVLRLIPLWPLGEGERTCNGRFSINDYNLIMGNRMSSVNAG